MKVFINLIFILLMIINACVSFKYLARPSYYISYGKIPGLVFSYYLATCSIFFYLTSKFKTVNEVFSTSTFRNGSKIKSNLLKKLAIFLTPLITVVPMVIFFSSQYDTSLAKETYQTKWIVEKILNYDNGNCYQFRELKSINFINICEYNTGLTFPKLTEEMTVVMNISKGQLDGQFIDKISIIHQ